MDEGSDWQSTKRPRLTANYSSPSWTSSWRKFKPKHIGILKYVLNRHNESTAERFYIQRTTGTTNGMMDNNLQILCGYITKTTLH